MNDELTIGVIPARQLLRSQRTAIISLCQRVYKSDVENLFKTYPSPTHVAAYFNTTLISHALWVTRWLKCDNGPLLRTAYVEMAATEPEYRGYGFTSIVLARLAEEVKDFELAAIWPRYPEWYGRLGWEKWRGPLFVRDAAGLLPTPNAEVMIKRLPLTPPLDLDGSLSAEWREGELW